MKKLLLILIIATLSTSANARVATSPQQLGLQALVNGIAIGIGWLMDEGTKSEKIPDPSGSGSSGSGSGAGSGSSSGTSGSSSGTGTGGNNVPAPAQTYPFEYLFDGQSFDSAESACSYAFSDAYLSSKNLKKTRRQDGTYLEKVDVYIGSAGSFHPSTPGYFTCTLNAGTKTIDYKNDIGGSIYSWSGRMVYKGTEKTTTTTVSDDYAERRAKALQAIQKAVEDAQAQTGVAVGGTTTDNPRTGTTTAPTTTDDGLARPVGVDTGTGATTGDTTTTNTTTNTNTTTTTTTNTHTNTKTETKLFELPTFCGWASTVCDFVDWFKDEPKPPPQESPIIDEKPLTRSVNDFDVMYLRFGGQCPAPVTHNLGLNNATFTIDLSPLCQFAILVRPVVLAMAYFLAIGIIANAIRDT